MEADPLQTADDYFACCAHQRVNYNPIRNGDGTMSARWTCALCIHEFVPKAALIAKHAEVGRLREALLNIVAEIRCDPTMDGSTRPRGLGRGIIAAYDAAQAALAQEAGK